MASSWELLKSFMARSRLRDFHHSKGSRPFSQAGGGAFFGFSTFSYDYCTLSSPTCDFFEEDCYVKEPFLDFWSAQEEVRLKWLGVSVSALMQITHDGIF